MIVTWRVWINIPETYWDMVDGNTDVKDYNDYQGEVIGTNKNFWNTTLVVACTDNKVREIDINEVKIIKDDQAMD